MGIRINQSGGTIDREEYYPFGDSSLRTFDKKRYRYCGKEKDEESGLYYYGARYYMAWVGRFISSDPLARDYPQLTPYNYAGNKPITHKDIEGLQSTGDKAQGGSVTSAASAAVIAMYKTEGMPSGGKPVLDNMKIHLSTSKSPRGETKRLSFTTTNIETMPIAQLKTETEVGLKTLPEASKQETQLSYSNTAAFAMTSLFVGAADQFYGIWMESYDHKNYVTTKGKVRPIPTEPRKISQQAQRAINRSQTIKGAGLGLNVISLGLGYAQVYDQYQHGEVSPLDVGAAGIGTVGLVANAASYFGYGGTVVTGLGAASGYIGMGIGVYQEWNLFYQMIFDFQKYNTPITDNPDETEWNRKVWGQDGVVNDADLYLVR